MTEETLQMTRRVMAELECYFTTIVVGAHKGPHLHHERAGAFTTTRGNVLIVTRENGKYREHLTGEGNWKTVYVPAGVPCCLYNVGPVEASIINMPNPAWLNNDDEHKVDGWLYQPPTDAPSDGRDYRVWFSPDGAECVKPFRCECPSCGGKR